MTGQHLALVAEFSPYVEPVISVSNPVSGPLYLAISAIHGCCDIWRGPGLEILWTVGGFFWGWFKRSENKSVARILPTS